MTEPLDAVFHALAAPTRRAILSRLAAGEAQVGELAAGFRISAPAISRHLKVLETAGLVTRRVEAQRRIIALNPEALRQASRWVDQYRRFWDGSLDRLESLLANEREEPRSSPNKEKPHEPTRPRRRD
jgi:DNA-binding transcriptional ArsR family regulator